MHRSRHDPGQVGFHVALSLRSTAWLLATVFAVAAASAFAAEQVDFAQRRLVASNGMRNDRFGAAVVVSGDTAVIGASTAARPDVTMGAAYIYAFNGSSWSEITELVPQGDRFGLAVAISGGTVVVTANNDDESGADDIGAA